MMRISIDTSEWPLVVVDFPAARIDDDDLRAYLGELGSFAETGARYVTLTDVCQLREPFTARQHWLFDAWLRRHVGKFERSSVGNAIVADSPLARATIVSAYWRWTDPPRYRLFRDRGEARAWCRARIEASGLAPGPAPHSPEATVPRLPVATGELIDLFAEPAFVVTLAGELVYANRAARASFADAPPWLAAAVASDGLECPVPVRLARVEVAEGALCVVIPGEGASLAGLPPSLERVARLVCDGLADKEIARATGLALETVRTYVSRLYRRAGVHSRAELVRVWLLRPASRGCPAPRERV